jgi:hypothetical protein
VTKPVISGGRPPTGGSRLGRSVRAADQVRIAEDLDGYLHDRVGEMAATAAYVAVVRQATSAAAPKDADTSDSRHRHRLLTHGGVTAR